MAADPALPQDAVGDILKAPWISELRHWGGHQASPHFVNFLNDLAPRLRLERTSLEILNLFSNTDEKSKQVADCLDKNPYYKAQFFKQIESLGRKEIPSTENAVVLLGMQRSRDLLCAMQLMRTTHDGPIEWDANGKLTFDPGAKVRLALQAEEAQTGKPDGYRNHAYAAGLIFDYLMELAQFKAPDPKGAAEFVDRIFKHGLRAGRVGYELSRVLPDFQLKPYAFAACMLHDVGKVVMALLTTEYLAFADRCLKAEVDREPRQFAERRLFKPDHTVFGHLICRNSRYFEKIDRAVLFHHEPHHLVKIDKPSHQLGCLVSLATNAASFFRKPDGKDDDLLVRTWTGPFLKDFSISRDKLLKAVAAAIDSG